MDLYKREFKNILCIRLDNMGDVLMSSPAFRALRETFNCRITLLTSNMGALVAPCIPSIDNVIEFNVPWVRHDQEPGEINRLVEELRRQNFDAAFIFSVFSQNPLPAAMLAYMAGIPVRVGYCRENPYHLLTHWVPEKEPYELIRHQVRRDLDLVKTVAAGTRDERIRVDVPGSCWTSAQEKLISAGFDFYKRWIVVHPGVSEKKREYPIDKWIEAGKRINERFDTQLIITGSKTEKDLAGALAAGIGEGAIPMAGIFDIPEFVSLIQHAPLLLSVNTSAVHIAAATDTPVIVLYALTNPQHSPWKVAGKVLLFDVPVEERSKNEVLRWVRDNKYPPSIPMVTPEEITSAVATLLQYNVHALVPEVIPAKTPRVMIRETGLSEIVT